MSHQRGTAHVPPHNLDAERALLGALLLERGSLPRAIKMLRPVDFYKDGHRTIFAAMLALFERNEPVDLLTLSEELRRQGMLEQVGGAEALASLVEEAAISVHAPAYAVIVRDYACKRELARIGDQLSAAALNGADVGELLASGATALEALRVRTSRPGDSPLVQLRPAREITAPPVSYLIDGLVPDAMLTVLSGRDGRGKTMLALEMARAVLLGTPLFGEFSVLRPGGVAALLLDDPLSLIDARLQALGIKDHDQLHIGTLEDTNLSDPVAMLVALADQVMQRKSRLIIVDSLYLLVPAGRDSANSQSMMGPIMVELNRVCQRTGAAVVLVAHDNKIGADVAGSHVIRAAAKVILRLLLPTGEDEDPDEGPTTAQRVLRVDKNKLGASTAWRVELRGVGDWRLHGSQRDFRREQLRGRVRDQLEDGGVRSVLDIARSTGARDADVRAVLRELVDRGQAEAVKSPSAKRGRPQLLYRRAEFPSQGSDSNSDRDGNSGQETSKKPRASAPAEFPSRAPSLYTADGNPEWLSEPPEPGLDEPDGEGRQ